MFRIYALAAAAALAASGQDSFPVASIQVQGNSRFTPEAVIRASGISVDQNATPKDFEAACNRLVTTGLFLGARYQFRPSAGRRAYDLFFIVTEETDLYEIRIDIPGTKQSEAWKWLEKNDGLAKPRGPTSTAALDYYKAAIERYLKEQGREAEVNPRLWADPNTGEVVAIFRPAVLANIAAVRFEGNQAVDAAALQKAIAPAVGTGYTEQDLRELLDLNVRPLYEDLGRYRVAFPRVSMEGGIVTVRVTEGQVYRLGAMQVAGDRLPIPAEELAKLAPLQPGEPPSWRKVSQAASAMATSLGRFGYLDASCEPDRDLDDANGRINIVFAIHRGPQYTMGALSLNGLDPASEARARSLWKLAPGAVLNLEYLQEFARVLMRDDKIRFKRFSMRHVPRQGRNVADVVFTFRPEETAAPRRPPMR